MTKTLTTCYFAFSFRLFSIQLKKCVENVPALMTLFTRLSAYGCMFVFVCVCVCVYMHRKRWLCCNFPLRCCVSVNRCICVSVGASWSTSAQNICQRYGKSNEMYGYEMKTNLSEGNQLMNCAQSEKTCYFCRFSRTLSRRISSSTAIDFSWIKVLRFKQNRLKFIRSASYFLRLSATFCCLIIFHVCIKKKLVLSRRTVYHKHLYFLV